MQLPKSKKPLSIAFYGMPQSGKTDFAAQFVKKFRGLVIEPAAIHQKPPISKERLALKPDYEKYTLEPIGHSSYALERVGLNMDTEYKYVKSWKEYQDAIDYAIFRRDELGKRFWLVIDDTNQWRILRAYQISLERKGKQMVQADYTEATGDLQIETNELKNIFNMIYINQVKENYVKGESTGEIVAAFYPQNLRHKVEISGKFYMDTSRNFEIEMLSTADVLAKDFERTILNVTPEKLLTNCKIPEEIW